MSKIRIVGRRWVSHQSEISLATAAFLLFGGLFVVVSFLFWTDPQLPRSPVLLSLGVLAFVLAIAVLVCGARIARTIAILAVTGLAAPLLVLAAITPLEIRAVNYGLFFFPFFVYLIWFAPRWAARAIGYSWLAIYSGTLWFRFTNEVNAVVATLVVSGMALGELVGVFRDRLERTTLTDMLCDTWNRRGFFRITEQALAAAARSQRPVSVLFCDLDGFKLVNDRHGHAEGDRVLREYARQLTAATRPQDTVARMGGDEFAVLLPDTTQAEAIRIGERARAVATVLPWSFGAANWRPGETVHAFLARADELMLEEKRARKAAHLAPDGRAGPTGGGLPSEETPG